MDRAVDAGINVFDTADAYGGGRSETYIGSWLRTRGSHVRERCSSARRCSIRSARARTIAASRAATSCSQVDASLARLATDRLDMYLIHEPDPETPIDETLGALDDVGARGQGAVRRREQHRGVAARRARSRSARRGAWCASSGCRIRTACSIASAEREMFPLCADRGLGFTAFSPLAGGWLTGKYRAGERYPDGSRMTLRPEPYRHLERDAIFRGLDALAREARERGVEMTALALAWTLHHPRMDAAIVGPRRPAHLRAALAALDVALSSADRDRLASAFEAPAV